MLEAQPEMVERCYWRIHLIAILMDAIAQLCFYSRDKKVTCDAWADRDRALPPDRF